MAEPARALRADAARNRARVLEVAYETFAAEGLSVASSPTTTTATTSRPRASSAMSLSLKNLTPATSGKRGLW
jgi:hypothetical protein